MEVPSHVEQDKNEREVEVPTDNKLGESNTDFFNPIGFDHKDMDSSVGPPPEASSTPKRKSQRKSVMNRFSSIRKSLSPVQTKPTSPLAGQKMQKEMKSTIHVGDACDNFVANPFKKSVCKNCQHLDSEHS